MEEIVLQSEVEYIKSEGVLCLMNVGLDEIKVTKKATGLFEVTHNEK